MVQVRRVTMATMVDDYSDRLKEAMEDRNVDEAFVSKKLKVSPQAVRKVLLGGSNTFSAENNAKAAKLLNVNPDWLVLGRAEPKSRVFGSALQTVATPQDMLRALRARVIERNPDERESAASLVAKYLAGEQESERTLNAVTAMLSESTSDPKPKAKRDAA